MKFFFDIIVDAIYQVTQTETTYMYLDNSLDKQKQNKTCKLS